MKVGKDFTNWIKGRINKYEFVENEDWKLTFAKTGERKNVMVATENLCITLSFLIWQKNVKIIIKILYFDN